MLPGKTIITTDTSLKEMKKIVRNKAIDELLEKQLEALEDFKHWEDSSGYPIHTMSETQRISKCKELIKKIAKEMRGK